MPFCAWRHRAYIRAMRYRVLAVLCAAAALVALAATLYFNVGNDGETVFSLIPAGACLLLAAAAAGYWEQSR